MRPVRASFYLILFSLFQNLSLCVAKTVSSLSDGPPTLMSSHLDPSSYTKVVAHRLTQARVLWINYALLREMGIDVPAEGMTTQFEKEILEAFGYAIPQADDPSHLFGPETKEFYADRYGGLGMNGNLGSGRAASAGKVQIKGIGKTPLVGRKVTDYGHAHGGASISESIQEAIWGEILHREMPNGANRVLAVISTGTYTQHSGWKEERALSVRVDPLRPAHFLSNGSVDGEDAKADALRVNRVLSRLRDSLPKREETKHLSDHDAIALGLREFIAKTGQQYAASYARRFFHGATSPSNFLMDGGSIDYGTQTAIPDFQKVKVLSDESYFGDTMMQKTDLLHEIIDDLAKTLPPSLRKAVPSREESDRLFDEAYFPHLRSEMLRLTGAPPELVSKMKNDPAANELAEELLKIARAGHDEVIEPKGQTLQFRGTYDLGAILNLLASHDKKSKRGLSAALKPLIPKIEVRRSLIAHFSDFYTSLQTQARKAGIPKAVLAKYVREAAEVRNRSQPDLYIGDVRWKLIDGIIKEAMKQNRPELIQQYIDGAVENNARDYKEAHQTLVRVRPDSNGYLRCPLSKL